MPGRKYLPHNLASDRFSIARASLISALRPISALGEGTAGAAARFRDKFGAALKSGAPFRPRNISALSEFSSLSISPSRSRSHDTEAVLSPRNSVAERQT